MGVALGLVAGGCIGSRRPQAGDGEAAAAAKGEAEKLLQPADVDDKLSQVVTGERMQALYDESDAWKGARDPLVTIVEYSDFQCPFCSRLATSLEEVVSEYPSDVRLVFKHYPLPNHQNAGPAARAAVAANEQGKFWGLHDLMFANQRALEGHNLDAYAKQSGLDLEKWKQRAAADDVAKQVAEDEAAGKQLQVSSTPTFFVNGRKFEGAKPIEQIKAIVEEERKLALQLVEAGSKREEIYARIMKAATPLAGAKPADDTPAAAAKPAGDAAAAAKPEPPPPVQFAVPLGDDTPKRGPTDALVTIVELGSFTAEATQKNRPVLEAVASKHPEVQWVYRHMPLDDAKAGRAARIAIAAHRQGKFWEMRDALVEWTGELDAKSLGELARKAGVDERKLRADLQDTSLGAALSADASVAEVVRGAEKAPIYFVNGRPVLGTPSVEELEKVIAEEAQKAEQWMQSQGVKKSPELYARMSQTWKGHQQFQAAGG